MACQSLPGAIGMYALSVGIQNLNQSLPGPVYALLSGLNAATVGIVAVSAVQLAEKAIRDRISRILVIFGACAGLCYNSLWYFPVLMVVGGLAIAIWDGWLYNHMQKLKSAWKNRHSRVTDSEEANADSTAMESIPPSEAERTETLRSRRKLNQTKSLPQGSETPDSSRRPLESGGCQPPNHGVRVWTGLTILIIFFGVYLSQTAILSTELI